MTSTVASAALWERLNPVALVAALVPSSVAVIVWLNPYSSGVALLLWVVLIVAAGGYRLIAAPTTLIVAGAAILSAISSALYGRTSGSVLWQLGPAVVSKGSLEIAVATAVRVLALALPAVALFRAIDMTRLADALEQTLRLPPRFAWGSFAGLRQLELANADWLTVQRARRARGVADGNAIAVFFSRVFAVFVLALQRGGELALTMESRGIESTSRVPSRVMRFAGSEWALLGAGLVIGFATAAIAMMTGGSLV